MSTAHFRTGVHDHNHHDHNHHDTEGDHYHQLVTDVLYNSIRLAHLLDVHLQEYVLRTGLQKIHSSTHQSNTTTLQSHKHNMSTPSVIVQYRSNWSSLIRSSTKLPTNPNHLNPYWMINYRWQENHCRVLPKKYPA